MATNLVGYDNDRIKQLTADNTANLAIRVLEYMATSNAFTGAITIGTSNPIGTFIDTARTGAVGSSNITIVSNTYTLSQVNTATLSATQDPPLYLGLDSSNPNTTKLKENLTTLNDLADYILSVAVSTGPFSYYLGTSAPSDGGTWVSLGILKDTLENFAVTNNSYHLWKKTSSGAYKNVVRPLRIKNTRLTSFTDTEIQALAKIVEQRIISTGIGTYVLQTSTPLTGTWVNAGTITDVRRTTNEVNYDALIPANYTGTTTVAYEGVSSASYDGITFVNYLGPSAVSYTGPAPVSYLGPAPVSYLGPAPVSYLGPGALSYIGPSPVTYTGTTNVPYTGVWPPGTFFTSPVQGYEAAAPPFVIFYAGGGISYLGPGVANFFGTSPANFTGFVPNSQSFTGFAPNSQSFTGFVPDSQNFTGFVPDSQNFTGIAPDSQNFTGIAPDSQNFSGSVPSTFFGTTPTIFFGTVPMDFLGVTPASYIGQIVNSVTETISTITLYKRIG